MHVPKGAFTCIDSELSILLLARRLDGLFEFRCPHVDFCIATHLSRVTGLIRLPRPLLMLMSAGFDERESAIQGKREQRSVQKSYWFAGPHYGGVMRGVWYMVCCGVASGVTTQAAAAVMTVWYGVASPPSRMLSSMSGT